MIKNRPLWRFLIILCLLYGGKLYPENSIPFDKERAFNVFGNYNIGMFNHNDQEGYSTDKPWDMGLGLRYRNISAQFFIPLSFPLSSSDLELSVYLEKIYYVFFYKRYHHFYRKNETRDMGLDITSTGTKAVWVHNHEDHPLSSVFKLDKRQNVSSGSFLYGFGVFYSSIHSENEINETMSRYQERQHIIYFGPIAGYSWTWVLSRLFLNLSFTTGGNLGINVRTGSLLFIPQIEPNIVIGHHDTTWSVNIKTMCNASIFLWGKNDVDTLGLATITMMFSKRF